MSYSFFNKKYLNIFKMLTDLPTPSSINYYWNFGSVLGVCLVIQIISGIFLSFHYVSYSYESFDNLILLMRDVWFGWLIRFIHMNGASMFFFFVYFHVFRGIYFFSSVHFLVWMSGCFILVFLMGSSFLGYVLPWGQMSYWAVAVITNLLSVIPFIGDFMVMWVWGGFTVGLPTLIRFYSFHFIFPMLVILLSSIHIILLHKEGSSNPMGVDSNVDKVCFHPFFSVKDFFFFFVLFFFFFFFCLYFPYFFSDPVNNVPANFMQTPLHIQPEWYFLPYYAILRSVSSKVGGVLSLVLSVLIFFFLSFYKFSFSIYFSYYRMFVFWMFFFSFLFLMKLGSLPAEEPYILISKTSSFLYFFFILIMNL